MFFDRRRFLKMGAQAVVTAMFPASVMASIHRTFFPKRRLSFYNTHTDERLDVCYYSNGRYHPKALKNIDYILRDHYSNKIIPIHKDLIDLLHAISMAIGEVPRFHIISGYRTLETNTMLRRISQAVAKNSLHMKGKAVDIRIPRCDTKRLNNICRRMSAGGVGYYPESDFVHVDTGDVRFW